MSLFENFPYTNLHELNLDWLINTLNDLKDAQVISVNGMTGEVILYENAIIQFPSLANNENWSLIRLVNGTQRGIAFGTDNKAYIVHGNQMGEVYTAGNQPPYPVTRVNGMTGDITLYSDSYVQLPTLTDAQLHNWTIFRTLNNVARGIQINDDGTLAIIAGNNRYTIYSENNPPFTDNEGTITFDPITDPDLEGWVLRRVINNTPVYIQLNNTGTVNFGVGNDFYQIYTTADTEDDVFEIPNETTGSTWGMIRETTEGSIGFLFNNDPLLSEPSVYIRYVDSNNVVHTEKLLTQSDIPSSSGVVSINGYTGVVSLLGSDIQVSTTDTRTIDDAVGDLTATDSAIKNSIVFLENTNISTHTIPSGSYVIWQNLPYISSQAIAVGDTLSSSNLTPIVSGGFINDLLEKTTKKTSSYTTPNPSINFSAWQTDSNTAMVRNNTFLASFNFTVGNTNIPAWTVIGTSDLQGNPNGTSMVTVMNVTDDVMVPCAYANWINGSFTFPIGFTANKRYIIRLINF